MSAIAAIFSRHGAPINRANLERMAAARPERGPDGQAMRIIGPAGLAHQHFWITPEEWGERQPIDDGDTLLSCDARLDNRTQLARHLELEPDQLRLRGDAALILLSYRKWGVDCLTHLLGEFAFVLWDAAKRQLFIARDALGARDICYYVDEQVFLIASEVSQLMAHPRIRPAVNDNRIAAYLAHLWDKPEESYYKQIQFLAPAHGMIVSEERVHMWRYWDVDPEARIRYKDEQEYADHYLELLREALRCRLRTVGPVAISLSGGLDSTSLAALAAPMLSQTTTGLSSFSYVFDELTSCDERRYIQPVVDRYQLAATYLPSDDKWPLKNLAEWPQSRDFVFADPFALLPAAVMEAAGKQGMRLLMGGYYGDVLFTGGQYWTLDMIRGKRLALLARTAFNNRSTINWRQEMFESGLRQLIPQKVARGYRRWRPRSVESISPAIHPDLVARSDVGERLEYNGRRDKYPAPAQWHRYRSLTLSIFSQGLAATRARYNKHGLETAQPYYDRRLIEFVMAVPAEELGRPDYDRRLHRQAMRGLLPEAVRRRRVQTGYSPLLLKGMQYEEKETVRRILSDPLVVQRKYINGDWLRKQMGREFDLSKESWQLWFVLSLELWLKRNWD